MHNHWEIVMPAGNSAQSVSSVRFLSLGAWCLFAVSVALTASPSPAQPVPKRKAAAPADGKTYASSHDAVEAAIAFFTLEAYAQGQDAVEQALKLAPHDEARVKVYSAAPVLQTRLLNAIDSPAIPGLGAWQVAALAVRIAQGVEPRLGAAAIEIAGTAKDGGKVDAPFFDGELPGCRRLAVWVSVAAASNAKEFGFQIRDAKGEWLLQTVPVDWTGWKRVELNPTAGGMKPAYAQKDHDGKVDLPITAVHLIWFAKAAGPTALVLDGLTAATEVQAGADGLVLTPLAASVLEPGQPLRARFIAENRGATEKTVAIRWNLQANPTFVDPVIPDPIQGFDQALGCRSTWSVDGTDRGDAKLCDGDEFTHSETPWGKGYTEAVATIDLGQARDVSAVRWQAGDANWIFKADLSTSRTRPPGSRSPAPKA